MLKDNIKKREEEMKKTKRDSEGDFMKYQMRGEVEIKAWKHGELFYHDGGSNTITLWAKHALVRLLSGDSFSSIGSANGPPKIYTQPDNTDGNHSSDGTIKNEDGTLLSGEQYFWEYSTYVDNFINRTSVGTNPADVTAEYHSAGSGRIYPFFPTKILFGTGKEFKTWTDAGNAGFTTFLTDEQGYTSQSFATNIDNEENYISHQLNIPIVSLDQARTVNDLNSTQLPDLESTYEDDFGIDGPIKDCLVRTTDGSELYDTDATTILGENGFILPEYNGVGRPAFIYCKRSDDWMLMDSAEISVKSDDSVKDNRIVFTAILPEQTDVNEGAFYPYNGHTETGMILKQVGLFNDVRLTINDVIPATNALSAPPYYYMPCGMMIAKRKISPITKTPAVRISVSWSLYF